MTQHRVYYTDSEDGYILCDSEKEAKEIKQDIMAGCPIDDLAHSDDIIVLDSQRSAIVKSPPN